MYLRCVFGMVFIGIGSSLRYETDAVRENIEQGKLKYQEFQRNTLNEKTGGCWGSAIADLEDSCSNLSEESTARLAYSFLTCHLQQHKRKIHICHDDHSIESCTNTLTDTMFGIYTAFVMHTHNMCFYIESAKWQTRIDKTVDILQDTSYHVAMQLEEQSHKQDDLLVGMETVSDMNTDILSKTEQLQGFISKIFHLVEKIGYLQQAFYEHFATYEMILFYIGSILLTFLCTSFPGVSKARPIMLCVTALSLASEHVFLQYDFITQDEISRCKVQKQIRKIWLLLCAGSWLKTLYSSGSAESATQQILSQTRETKRLLQDIQNQLTPFQSIPNISFYSDDDTITSDTAVQTDSEVTPLIIKQRRYNKKRNVTTPKSLNRSGIGRYNLRPLTPSTLPPPSITWPGFSSEEDDEEYFPHIDQS